MARYFFHVVNGSFNPDTVGIDCADADEVKEQAVRAAGEMLKDLGLKLWQTKRWYMFATDEGNRTRLKLSFDAEDLTGELARRNRSYSEPLAPLRSGPFRTTLARTRPALSLTSIT